MKGMTDLWKAACYISNTSISAKDHQRFLLRSTISRRKRWIHTGDSVEIVGFPTESGGFPANSAWGKALSFLSLVFFFSRENQKNQRKGRTGGVKATQNGNCDLVYV